MNHTNDLNWMVGGPQGSGVDSAAKLFALAAARAGLHVVGQREYYSNIMGKHSYYKLRVADRPVRSQVADVHLLTTYDAETLVRHVHGREVVPRGAVLYAPAEMDVEVGKLPNLDQRVKDEVAGELTARGLEATAGNVLELARERDVRTIAVPYDDILERVGSELDISDPRKLNLLKNTVAVGASLGVLDLDPAVVEGTIRHVFGGKGEKVQDMNVLAATHARHEARALLTDFGWSLDAAGEPAERLWLQGTDVVALGKVLGGCRFQTYYPISPATDESTYLESIPESGVVVVQTEDEIAAVTMAAGAALTGARAATSTSGPGFSLMVEGLGWAGMCEVPLVVVDYTRGGPSTGLPTRTGQGDLQFALRLGHADFPRLVVCPGDHVELFHDTIHAFNWAERYQTPVILMVDKSLAGNSVTLDVADLRVEEAVIERGRLADDDALDAGRDDGGRFRRYAFVDDGVSPRSVLGQEGGIHWVTGDEHTELGHISEDPVVRERMVEKRQAKLLLADREIPDDLRMTLHGPDRADVTIVAFGATKGPILEAMEILQGHGIKANFLQLRVMSPFPRRGVREVLERAERVLVVEENSTGQLRDLVAQETGIRVPHTAHKYNGRPTMPHEVVVAVESALKGTEEVVMRHGV